jgi:uncharacterized spore protein YtfJ
MTTSVVIPNAAATIDMDRLRDFLAELSRHANADVAFATPRMVGERLIIPVANVRYMLAGGSGGGVAPEAARPWVNGAASAAGGSGAGGVGGLSIRPIAVIEATASGVRMRPIVDVPAVMTRVCGFVAAALLMGMFARRRYVSATVRPIVFGGWRAKRQGCAQRATRRWRP